MELEDRIRLETPEGVALDLRLAGLGSRAVAGMVDVLIWGVAIAGIVLLTGVGLEVTRSAGAIAVGVLLATVVVAAYDVAFEQLAAGRTPGKRALGLRVVRLGGEPVTFTASLVRNVLRLVDFLPLLYGLGGTAVLVSRRNQRLGDLAAGTLVVRERVAEHRGGGGASSAAAHVHAAGLDATAVGAEDLRVIASFLDRRPALPADVRQRLARDLAGHLRERVAGIDPDVDDETLLEAVVVRRSGGG